MPTAGWVDPVGDPGFFSVGSRDSAAQSGGGEGYTPPQDSTIDKKVRVVVTFTYYLDR